MKYSHEFDLETAAQASTVTPIIRHANGAIDMAPYLQRGRVERSLITHTALRAIGGAVRRASVWMLGRVMSR
ncbi:MAG: hypothetical protein KC451_13720 [Amylibacter sp.]|nr:hypothetical protein [Amylibacter sp.]